MDDKLQQFLQELSSLTEKYGIIIAGCGCCGSPYLKSVKGDIIGDDLTYLDGKYFVLSDQ